MHEREGYLKQIDELLIQLKAVEGQLAIAEEKIRIERDLRLVEMKLRLSALHALMAYRTTRRPRIVKILTFGIVGDKRDPLLLAQIEQLQNEIAEWK